MFSRFDTIPACEGRTEQTSFHSIVGGMQMHRVKIWNFANFCHDLPILVCFRVDAFDS